MTAFWDTVIPIAIFAAVIVGIPVFTIWAADKIDRL
jgi:hypothetical protein